MSNGAVGGLVIAMVVGLIIGAFFVWKITKAEKGSPSMAYASNQSRAAANDAAQAQVQAETETGETEAEKDTKT
jgi:CHASE3 domain sensor protein